MASKKNSNKAKSQAKGSRGAGKGEKTREKSLPGFDPSETAIAADKNKSNEEVAVIAPPEAAGDLPAPEEARLEADQNRGDRPQASDSSRADKPMKSREKSLPGFDPSERAIGVDKNQQDEEIAIIDPPDAAGDLPATEAECVEAPRKRGGIGKQLKQKSETEKISAQDPSPKITLKTRSGPRLPDGISPRPLFKGNPYMPLAATVMEVIRETHNIHTLRIQLDDERAMADFTFEPGQVAQISVFGAGEATFVINSPPSEKRYLQFSVMRTGEVTNAIHRLSAGDKVGLRAPLGNFFPYESWKGKNVYFIGGGIGMAPIRTIMLYLLENKADYGKISLLYGARSPKDMAYSYELDSWKHNPDLDCTLCIDNPHEEWDHKVGLIPMVLEELNPGPANTVAVLCGPPVMIKFTLIALQKLGFSPENIVTTLEKRMKCGIGICGRCNIGDRYVCVDGPVFTLKELDGLPPDL